MSASPTIKLSSKTVSTPTRSVQWITPYNSPSYMVYGTATQENIDTNGNPYESSLTLTTTYSPTRDIASPSSSSTMWSSESATGSGYAGQHIASDSTTSLSNNGIYTDFSTYIDPAEVTGLFNGTDANSITSESNGSTETESANGMSPTTAIIIGVVVGLIVLGSLAGCCLYRRRRRRLNALPGNSKGRKTSKRSSKWDEIDVEVPALPSPTSPTDAAIPGPRPSTRLSHRDLRHIVLSRPAPVHSPTSANGPSPDSASPFMDPPHLHTPLTRGDSRRSESTYTDNTEYDMLAQDGSSYARTLSTYSEGVNSEYSERDLGYVPPLSATAMTADTRAQVGRRVEGTSAGDAKDPNGPSHSSSTWTGDSTYTGTGTSTTSARNHLLSSNDRGRTLTPLSGVGADMPSTQNQPLSASSASRPLLSLSPFSDPSPEPSSIATTYQAYNNDIPNSPASSRSWRTEDEALFRHGSVGSRSHASRAQPTTQPQNRGVRRGLTIVRHVDGGAISPTRGNEDGDEDEAGAEAINRRGEMHFPPSYGDLYPAR